METTLQETFSPVMKIFAMSGYYFPGSDVIYKKYPVLVRRLSYIILVTSIIVYIMETANEFLFVAWNNKAEGMTDIFMILALSVILPTYIFTPYCHWRRRDIEGIVEIWEKDMKNPPYPEDRKAEIENLQKYLSRIVKAELYGLIIPFTVWSARSLITKEAVLPVLYTGEIGESPAYELVALFFGSLGYSLTTVWCVTENMKLLFMKCILAELNHLYIAADKVLTFKEPEETDPEKRRRELTVMADNLRSWIIYHQTVLRFSEKINDFTAPIVLLQDIFALAFSSTSVFVLVTGDVPFDNWLSGWMYVLFYYQILYITNSLGDDIQTKSRTIFESFNGKEYYRYTKDIRKNIIFIQYYATHRPITLRATWYKSLSRKSLGEMASRGYEIVTFMRHLVGRNEI